MPGQHPLSEQRAKEAAPPRSGHFRPPACALPRRPDRAKGSTRVTADLRSIFVLTGAGVSAESGLGTFRDRGGLWARFDPMRLATPEAYAADPDTVLDFYDHRRRGV